MYTIITVIISIIRMKIYIAHLNSHRRKVNLVGLNASLQVLIENLH